MNFEHVLNILLNKFEELKINYSVMGGFAMGISGINRATQDIDFLIEKSDMDKLHPHLVEIGYDRIYYSENVSQYTSYDTKIGSIDFIHAFREKSLTMLSNCKKISLFNGKLTVNVLRVEDIIGLKVQSICNNPERKNIDYIDIEQILNIHGKNIDWKILNEYFSLFDMNKDYEILKKKYGLLN